MVVRTPNLLVGHRDVRAAPASLASNRDDAMKPATELTDSDHTPETSAGHSAASPAAPSSAAPIAVAPQVTQVCEIDADGAVWVTIDEQPMRARVTGGLLSHLEEQADVLVVFDRGDPLRPIVVETVHERVQRGPLSVDSADQVQLRCGAASVTLNADGDVRLKGRTLSNEANATYRIAAPVVKVN